MLTIYISTTYVQADRHNNILIQQGKSVFGYILS